MSVAPASLFFFWVFVVWWGRLSSVRAVAGQAAVLAIRPSLPAWQRGRVWQPGWGQAFQRVAPGPNVKLRPRAGMWMECFIRLFLWGMKRVTITGSQALACRFFFSCLWRGQKEWQNGCVMKVLHTMNCTYFCLNAPTTCEVHLSPWHKSTFSALKLFSHSKLLIQPDDSSSYPWDDSEIALNAHISYVMLFRMNMNMLAGYS